MKQLSLRFAFQFMLFPSPETSLQTLLVAKVFILSYVLQTIYLKLGFTLFSQITLASGAHHTALYPCEGNCPRAGKSLSL